MKKVWLVAANKSLARVFQSSGTNSGLKPVEEFHCEDARLPTRAFRRDKKFRVFEHFSMHRHSMGGDHQENKDLLRQFSRQIAEFLMLNRKNHRFDFLVLVAAPEVLGEIRKNLDEHTAACLIEGVDKNPREFDEKDLLRLSSEAINKALVYK